MSARAPKLGRLFCPAILAALVGGAAAGSAQPATTPPAVTETATPADSVTARLFERNVMGGVTRPSTFDYGLTVSGTEGAQDGRVQMQVRQVDADGSKNVWFETDGAAGAHAFGPVAAREQNPLVIVFLQRDVARMERLTGGSQQYFRNKIRQAFNSPARVESREVAYEGRQVQASSLSITPFTGDPHLDRLPELKGKVYEFVVSDAVPGGIYALATHTPDPSGSRMLAEETLTLSAVTDLPREE